MLMMWVLGVLHRMGDAHLGLRLRLLLVVMLRVVVVVVVSVGEPLLQVRVLVLHDLLAGRTVGQDAGGRVEVDVRRQPRGRGRGVVVLHVGLGFGLTLGIGGSHVGVHDSLSSGGCVLFGAHPGSGGGGVVVGSGIFVVLLKHGGVLRDVGLDLVLGERVVGGELLGGGLAPRTAAYRRRGFRYPSARRALRLHLSTAREFEARERRGRSGEGGGGDSRV